MLLLDTDFVQGSDVAAEFLFSGREFVRAEDVSDDIGVLARAEVARVVGGHGLSGALIERAGGLAVPVLQELGAGQGRSGFPAREVLAVALRAFLLVDGLAATRLVFGVNPVPDGARGGSGYDGHNDEEESSMHGRSDHLAGVASGFPFSTT